MIMLIKEGSDMTNPGNFNPEIHSTDFRKPFEAYRVGRNELVPIDGRKMESLNGKWHFLADPLEYMLRGSWYKEEKYDEAGREKPQDYDFDSYPKMKVPSCWNMERSDLFYYESMGDYIRNFRYVKHSDDERVFLHFEGAAYRTYVFLNGKPVGMHDGGSTPFTVEITDAVAEQNRLIVAVDGSRSDTRVPMSNTDWFFYSGIYRDVYVIRTGRTVIKDWFVRLVPDTDFSEIALDFEADGLNEGTAVLRIPELGIEKDVNVKEGKGSIVLKASPELWSPENPKLYDVELSYDGDTVKDRIGFREFKVVGNDIYLNGKKRFMKGICLHEDDIKMGKCTTEASIREAIRVVKEELHGVFIRLAHYPHTRLFAKIADEMGIMLWEEIPVYWAIAFDNESTYKDAENQLGELIRRDHNRASVVIWSVGNENADTDARFRFMSSLADFAHSQDNTRAVGAACLVNEVDERIEDRLADSLDIIGINEYYGWYNPDFSKLGRVLRNSAPSKPVIITEVGAGARAGNHGTSDMLWTEEFQEEFYRKQVAEIGSCSFIKGVSPWILYDFRAERRFNSYQEGFNRKGLIDSDRKTKKLAFAVLASFYETKE